MQKIKMTRQIFQWEQPLVNFSNVTANADLVRACPSKVPQLLTIMYTCMRSSQVGLTYPVAYSIVMMTSVTVRMARAAVSEFAPGGKGQEHTHPGEDQNVVVPPEAMPPRDLAPQTSGEKAGGTCIQCPEADVQLSLGVFVVKMRVATKDIHSCRAA